MKKATRTLCLILSIVMLVTVLAACGTTAQPPSAPPADTSSDNSGMMQTPPVEAENAKYAEHIDIIVDNNRISVVNPMVPASNGTSTHWVMTMIFDRLINFNESKGEFEPALAKKWETTDYKTFTFDLRDDVTFHNGEKFTAHDVIYTIEMAREATGSIMSSHWAPVETATAVNDYTLELVLGSVNVDFFYNLALPQAGILNEKAVNADPDYGPCIGTGPFVFRDFASNEYVGLERNDNYWGTMPLTKAVTLRYIPEVSARTTMLLNNESQISFGTSTEDYDQFGGDQYSIFPLTINNVQGFSFNMQNPITADLNFRMAVLHAINNEDIAIFAAGDWATPLNNDNGGGTIWGYATEFRNNNIPVVPFDIEKAKEYLAASSYNGETIELAASIHTNIKASEVLQEQLAVIGVKAEVKEMDTAGLNSIFKTPNHHIIFHGINFTNGAGSARNVFLPDGALNRGSYENAEVTQLLTEAASQTDAKERERIYMKIQELVDQDKAFYNVFWRINGVVGVKGVGGLVLPADTNQIDLRGVYQIID